MKQKILVLLILISCGLYAQKESAHWYFGYNSGMNFINTYTVTNATINGVTGQTLENVPSHETGPISTEEGCFSISKPDGTFLFTSDGRFVYNKNKALMPNGSGLKGHASATQSGIVIPRPNHPDNFYIVTASAYNAAPQGLYYYEVSMDKNTNGGYEDGNVLGPYSSSIPTGTLLNFKDKNTGVDIYASTEAYENISAVEHADGENYWLIHRCRNYFFVWLVSENGINPTPDAYYPIGDDPGNSPWGGLKFSPDGQYIASAIMYAGQTKTAMTIAEFNLSTGVVSNVKNFITAAEVHHRKFYGMSFSQNSKYLYYATTTSSGSAASAGLYRRTVETLLSGASETPVTIFSNVVDNIQMGMDGRIYGISSKAWSGSTTYRNLYIILNPDADNPNRAIVPNFFPTSNGTHVSLPTFSSSFFSAREMTTEPQLPACIGKEITFSVSLSSGSGINKAVEMKWDFGDGSSLEPETDMDQYDYSRKHTYTIPGTYTVRLIPYKADGTELTSKIKTKEVRISRCIMPVNHNISVMEYYD